MIKNKKLSWLFRVLTLVLLTGVSYPLYKNISDQKDVNVVFDYASQEVKDSCTKSTKYNELFVYFNKDMSDSYHMCIVNSKDQAFRTAASKYILDRLSKNGETEGLKALKSAIEG